LWNSQTRQLRVLSGHTDSVSSLALSSNGKLLASGSMDKTAKIWDAQGNLIATLLGQGALVSEVEWSHDDKYLLSASMVVPMVGKLEDGGINGNGSVIIWRPDGTFVARIDQDEMLWARWQPQHNTVITLSRTTPALHFWNTQGKLVGTPEMGFPFSIDWSA